MTRIFVLAAMLLLPLCALANDFRISKPDPQPVPKAIPAPLAPPPLYGPPAPIELKITYLPPALMDGDNKPVDPLCFMQAFGGENVQEIKIADCRKGLDVKPEDFYVHEDGTIGSGFRYKEDAFPGMRGPFSQYRYIGNLGEDIIVEMSWSGGGTGIFSSILAMRRPDPATLHFTQTYAGGDRCNGGIASAAITDGILEYDQHITPYDFLTITNDRDRPLLKAVRPYDDLIACAACCYGTAHFKKNVFQSVVLDETLLEHLTEEEGEASPMQGCFDDLLQSKIEGGAHAGFDRKALKSFLREFEQVCLRDETGL